MTRPVVYVDDEPALCRLVRWKLERAGIAVETFTDPREALAWIDDHEPRAVLCDHRMPGLSGLDVRARLDPTLPFWLVTGDLSVADGSGADAPGPAVLRKPIDFDALLSLLRALPERG